MRIIADLATSRIIQASPTPQIGEKLTVNGRWILPVPDGSAVVVDSSSTISSVETDCLSEMLIRYPMYDFIIGNWFRETADLDAVNQTPGSGPLASALRYRMGRKAALPNPGVAPNCIEIPGVNPYAAVAVPGQLVLGTIDLTAADGAFPGIPGGTDEVMLWWELATSATSEDVCTAYGNWTGSSTNTPAERTLTKANPEPANFEVYVSNDEGASWYQAYHLEPIDLTNLDTRFRIAFVNRGTTPVHLLAFCALFPDTWP